MQEDMHYYGTYAMARAAGMKVAQARIVASAAQYVDDSTANDSQEHEDGGMLQATATAHTNSEAIENAMSHHEEQRRVWVPFHFYPGNEGNTLSQRLLCVKNSKLARQMVKNHIRHAIEVKKEYGLALMGVMAHVYADTFSHYGFSGVGSRNNAVDGDSFNFEVENSDMLAYINNKYSRFIKKYTSSFIVDNWRKVVSGGAEKLVGCLGHGGVGTYPDRPFLKWSFAYEHGDAEPVWRDNQETFLEGCEKLHRAFSFFLQHAEPTQHGVEFDSIRDEVRRILALEADMEGRTEAWRDSIRQNRLFESAPDEALDYSPHEWEQQKDNFHLLPESKAITQQDIYQFHQAANYHRNYTLKELLPRYGIVVL